MSMTFKFWLESLGSILITFSVLGDNNPLISLVVACNESPCILSSLKAWFHHHPQKFLVKWVSNMRYHFYWYAWYSRAKTASITLLFWLYQCNWGATWLKETCWLKINFLSCKECWDVAAAYVVIRYLDNLANYSIVTIGNSISLVAKAVQKPIVWH